MEVVDVAVNRIAAPAVCVPRRVAISMHNPRTVAVRPLAVISVAVGPPRLTNPDWQGATGSAPTNRMCWLFVASKMNGMLLVHGLSP